MFFKRYAVVFLLLVVSVFFFSVVDAHGDEEHSELPSKVNVCHSLSEAEKNSCYVALCEDGVSRECTEDIMRAAVIGSGPKFALAVLTDLSLSPAFASADTLSADMYTLAREIGMQTAWQYGTSGEIFSRCGKDFHYGCYYGFFEAVVGDGDFLKPLVDSEIPTFVEGAESICHSLPNLDQKMCYHKMGHMFLKHSWYTLPPALSVCDSLPVHQEHCWDGVFMENVNHFFFSNGTGGSFSEEDPFAPCTNIADIYREKCYKNHGRYLLEFFEGSPAHSVADICLDVGKYAEVCQHSVMDAIDGTEHHHEHGEESTEEVAKEKELSWFQRLINFILSLFGGGDDDDTKDKHDESMMHSDSMMPMQGAATDPNPISDIEEKIGTASTGVEHRIVYRDNVYIPDTLQIAVGDTVTWVNESSVFWPASDLHPTHKKYPGSNITKCGTPERKTLFDACEAMGPEAEYSFIFHEVGEWEFHDHINPRAKGTITVTK